MNIKEAEANENSIQYFIGSFEKKLSKSVFSLLESRLMFPPTYGQAGGIGPLFVDIVISCLL